MCRADARAWEKSRGRAIAGPQGEEGGKVDQYWVSFKPLTDAAAARVASCDVIAMPA